MKIESIFVFWFSYWWKPKYWYESYFHISTLNHSNKNQTFQNCSLSCYFSHGGLLGFAFLAATGCCHQKWDVCLRLARWDNLSSQVSCYEGLLCGLSALSVTQCMFQCWGEDVRYSAQVLCSEFCWCCWAAAWWLPLVWCQWCVKLATSGGCAAAGVLQMVCSVCCR